MIYFDKIKKHLEDAKKVEQTSKFHLENYYEHVLMVFDNLYSQGAAVKMLLAALLHDCGKPSTAVNRPGKGWTFYNHEIVGSEMIKEFISEDDPSYGFVVEITRAHMLPFGLTAPAPWGEQNKAKFEQLSDELKAQVLEFNRADAKASISSEEGLSEMRAKLPNIEKKLENFFSLVLV